MVQGVGSYFRIWKHLMKMSAEIWKVAKIPRGKGSLLSKYIIWGLSKILVH